MKMMRRRALIGQGDSLPRGYIRCKYLESTGEQYINTGIYPSMQTNYTLKYELTSPAMKRGDHSIFGTRNTTATDGYLFDIWLFHSSFDVSFTLSDTHLDFRNEQAVSINTQNQVKKVGNAFYLNDELIWTSSATELKAYRPILLFRSFNSTGLPCRIYSCVLIEGERKIMAVVPALDKAGRPCMFDTVTRTPYYNIGAGEFLYKVVGEQ